MYPNASAAQVRVHSNLQKHPETFENFPNSADISKIDLMGFRHTWLTLSIALFQRRKRPLQRRKRRLRRHKQRLGRRKLRLRSSQKAFATTQRFFAALNKLTNTIGFFVVKSIFLPVISVTFFNSLSDEVNAITTKSMGKKYTFSYCQKSTNIRVVDTYCRLFLIAN